MVKPKVVCQSTKASNTDFKSYTYFSTSTITHILHGFCCNLCDNFYMFNNNQERSTVKGWSSSKSQGSVYYKVNRIVGLTKAKLFQINKTGSLISTLCDRGNHKLCRNRIDSFFFSPLPWQWQEELNRDHGLVHACCITVALVLLQSLIMTNECCSDAHQPWILSTTSN